MQATVRQNLRCFNSLPVASCFLSMHLLIRSKNSDSPIMNLPLYQSFCGFLRQWMVFVFRVEGTEWKGFLQVLLAPQTKLRGRGRSVRGEEHANMSQLLLQQYSYTCTRLAIWIAGKRTIWIYLAIFTLKVPGFLSPILPVVGYQVALWAWQALPVRLSQTPPLPRLPRGWWVWHQRGAERSFFSSVSFCAVCPCCAPSCVNAAAGAGGWIRGGGYGEKCVCDLW